MNWQKSIFLVVCTLILTSCVPSLKKTQLYSGAKLSSNKIAVLKDCQEKCNNYRVYIQQTDISQKSGYSDTELLPGEYDATIEYIPELWFPKASPKKHQKKIKFKVGAGNIYSVKCEMSRCRPFTGYYETKDWNITVERSVDSQKCNKNKHFPSQFTKANLYSDYSLINLFAGYMLWDNQYNNKDMIGVGMYSGVLNNYLKYIFSHIPLTDEEISAIEERSVFQGMSEEALALSWGGPLAQIGYSGGGSVLYSHTSDSFSFDAPSVKPKKGEELFLYMNRKHEGGTLFKTARKDASYIYISSGKIVRIEPARGKHH